MDPQIPRTILGPEIYDMKHALIVYLNALWETVDVLHDVRYGDAELITDEPRLLEQLGLLADSVKQQRSALPSTYLRYWLQDWRCCNLPITTSFRYSTIGWR